MSEAEVTPAASTREHPNRRGISPPVLTWVMSILCVVLTVAHQTSERMNFPPGSFWYRMGHFGHLPATSIWGGQWPALFTTFFIHGDPARPFLTVLHLGFNLIVLLQAGSVLEKTLHPLAYYLFFVLSAIVGSGTELAITGSTGVGASGVVYAMFGLLWAGRKHDEEWADVANPPAIAMVIGWAFFCVILTWLHIVRIANGAHFGGLLFGLAVGWLFYAPRRRPLAIVMLGSMSALVVMSLTWMPWSPYWTFWKGVKARRERRYVEAISWFERSGRLGMDPLFVRKNIVATLIFRDHPGRSGVLQNVPEQPDAQRFGERR